MVVPCKIVKDFKEHAVQTYVIKVNTSPDIIQVWANGQGVLGAGAYAVVYITPDTTLEEELYLVLTLDKAYKFQNRAASIKQSIEQLPGDPKVEWVSRLTRRLQRRFGWGDVCSTTASVTRACEKGDKEELLAILPDASDLIQRGEFTELPALYNALSAGMIAERTTGTIAQRMITGPALVPAPAECGTSNDLLRAYHDIARAHVWHTTPREDMQFNKKSECTICDSTPAVVCACGAQRCGNCVAACMLEDECNGTVWQHPVRPLPFYVIDNQVSEKEKLLWLRQEIGECASLPDFASTYLGLFGDQVHTPPKQKENVLQLFGLYSPVDSPACSWRKCSDLPDDLLGDFLRVWDPNADPPRRCRACPKVLADNVALTCHYCSDVCRDAGTLVTCRLCEREKGAARPGECICYTTAPIKPSGNNPIAEAINHNVEQMQKAKRNWYEVRVPNPDYVPPRKRRRI